MFGRLFGKSNITIKGQTFVGDSVDIVGRRVIIDGVEVMRVDDSETKLHVEVTGVLGQLKADGSVNCSEVHGNVDAGGSVTVQGKVGNDVDAGGSVTVTGDVTGNVEAGGSIKVGGSIKGDADAGGSIRMGK